MDREHYQNILIALYHSVEQTLDTLNPLLENHIELWQHDLIRKKLLDDLCSLFRVCIVERLGYIKPLVKS